MISLPEQQFDLMETFKKAVSNGGSVIKYVTSSFTTDATLLFVPTGVLASNQAGTRKLMAEIERVLTDYSKQSHLISNQKIINKIITSSQIVEESIMTVSHSETINWLLPGVKATKKEIQLSLVSIMALEGDKVSQYRVYWDQASVLSQISVLPRSLYCKANGSEVTLPIVNSVQQLALVLKDQVQEAENESPEKVETNPRLNPQRNAPSQDFLQHDNSFRPSSRVIERPGGKTSNIFGTEEDAFRPSSRVLSRPGGKTNDIFNTGPEPEAAKKPVLKPKSSDIFSDEPIQKKEVNRRDPNRSSLDDDTIHRPGHKQFQDLNNRSQFTIGEDSNTNEAIRTGKQINPTNNQSQISFGEVEPVRVVGTGRRDPNARSEETVNRPSSRVLNNPGGKSTFSFA